EKRRRILAESLREVSMGLGASLEVDRVLDGILDGLARVIAVQAAMIVLYDDESDTYRVSAAHGELEDETLLDRFIVNNTDTEAAIIALFHPESDDSSLHQAGHMLLPLRFGEALIGYLAVDKTGTLSNDDREMLAAFAMQSAMAIANAQLYMAQREEAWVSTALLQVAEATARATSLDETLQTVTRITPLLVGVEWCSILLCEDGIFRIAEIEGLSPDLDQHVIGQTLHPKDWPPLKDMLATRSPVMLDQVAAPEIAREYAGRAHPLQITRGVMLPLFAKGDIVGAMLIGQLDSSEPFSHRKLDMVGGIANQAALAIESAQLYAAQQEEAWVTTALLQVAEAVNAQVDITSTLQTIVRLTPLLVGVTHCVVLRWDSLERYFCEAVSYGLPPEAEETLSSLFFPSEQHPFFDALLNAAAPLETGPDTPYSLPGLLEHYMETPSVLGLPLTTQGKLVGVMLVNDPNRIARMDQRRTNILTGIAYQTAIAIETNQLQASAADRQRLERELEVAQNIQTSFLPDSNPSIQGWDVASYYRAARMVGGDFYDFLALPGGKWGLVVADVADKGIPAALYMALCRTLLRAVARNRDNPAQALLRVNKLLLEDTRSDLFVTVWYAIWNPKDGTLFYSSAGHNPPLVIQHNGSEVETLRLKGIALGVLANITLHTARITLEPGDTLVMYTDGVTEAHNARDEQFTVSGLEAAVSARHGATAQTMIDSIITALDVHTGSEPQFDDLTLVIVKRQE
ncbi:MAG: SpoIIE family protein phosphatase, partial [Anaerolineae bacterium]|nr:SpoIIE family protein phosphatase [Anaerolineae bacterium]